MTIAFTKDQLFGDEPATHVGIVNPLLIKTCYKCGVIVAADATQAHVNFHNELQHVQPRGETHDDR